MNACSCFMMILVFISMLQYWSLVLKLIWVNDLVMKSWYNRIILMMCYDFNFFVWLGITLARFENLTFDWIATFRHTHYRIATFREAKLRSDFHVLPYIGSNCHVLESYLWIGLPHSEKLTIWDWIPWENELLFTKVLDNILYITILWCAYTWDIRSYVMMT